MANLPITQLPEIIGAPDSGATLPIVQGGVTSRILVSNFVGPYITTGSLNEVQTIQGFLQWKDDSNNPSGYIASYNTEVGSIYLRSANNTNSIAVYNNGISLIGEVSSSSNISASGNLIISDITASGNISASGYISASQIRTPAISAILGTFGLATTVVNDNISSSGFVLANNITASGNISASGNMITTNITASNISASGTIIANSISSSNVNFSGTITASNISASGWISASELVITGDSIFENDVQINDDLIVLGNTTLGNAPNLDKVKITGSFYVSGSNIRFDNDANYNGIEFTGSTDFSRDVTVRDDLFVYDDSSLSGSSNKIGNKNIANNLLRISSSVSQTGSFRITGNGNSIFTNDFKSLDITGSTGITANLIVGGHITSSGNISSSGDLVVRNITASGAISASGELLVDNNITATGNLIINGNSTLGNTNTDVNTLKGIVSVVGAITSSGNISSSATIIGENLIISKNTILGNEVALDLIEISGSFSTTGSVKMQGNGDPTSQFKALEVTGSAQISDNLTIGDDLIVKDASTLQKEVTIGYLTTDTNNEAQYRLNVSASSANTNSARFDGGIVVTGSVDIIPLPSGIGGNLSGSINTTASYGHFKGTSFEGNGSQLSNITVGTNAGRVPYTGVGGQLFTEAGFEYDVTDDRLTVSKITTTEFTSSFVTSSQIFSSGSNFLGDDTTDTQTLVGTVVMTGSAELTGSLDVNLMISATTVSASLLVLSNLIAATGTISSADNLEAPQITGSKGLLIQKSLGEGTPTAGTSNLAIFQNNDSDQDASIAIVAADSKKSQLHFGKHDDIDVGGIRYFHEDDSTAPDVMKFRTRGANVASLWRGSGGNQAYFGVGTDITTGELPTDYFTAQGTLSGGGLLLSSSNGTGIIIDRGANTGLGTIKFKTDGLHIWTLGNITGENDDNFYIYNSANLDDKSISLISGSNSSKFHTNVTASGNISSSGKIIGNSIEVEGKTAVTYSDPSIIFGQTNKTSTLRGSSLVLGVDATQHITASGNISSSGRVITREVSFAPLTNDYIRNSNDQIQIKSSTESIFLAGNVTASANISASGKLFAGLVSESQLNVVVYNTTSGELSYVTSESVAGSGDGSVTSVSVSGSFLLNTTDTLTGDLTVSNKIDAVSGVITNITSSGHIISTGEVKLVGNNNYYTNQSAGNVEVTKFGADSSGHG